MPIPDGQDGETMKQAALDAILADSTLVGKLKSPIETLQQKSSQTIICNEFYADLTGATEAETEANSDLFLAAIKSVAGSDQSRSTGFPQSITEAFASATADGPGQTFIAKKVNPNKPGFYTLRGEIINQATTKQLKLSNNQGWVIRPSDYALLEFGEMKLTWDYTTPASNIHAMVDSFRAFDIIVWNARMGNDNFWVQGPLGVVDTGVLSAASTAYAITLEVKGGVATLKVGGGAAVDVTSAVDTSTLLRQGLSYSQGFVAPDEMVLDNTSVKISLGR